MRQFLGVNTWLLIHYCLTYLMGLLSCSIWAWGSRRTDVGRISWYGRNGRAIIFLKCRYTRSSPELSHLKAKLHAHLGTLVDSLSRLYSSMVLGSGYSSIAGMMLPSVAVVTLKAFLVWVNSEVADVKLI